MFYILYLNILIFYMIYLYCLTDSYIFYKKYIDLLIKNNTYIRNIIIDDVDKIIEYIELNDLQYFNHILIINISENIIKRINIISNLYLLNTKKINIDDDLSYLYNYNIKILTYNFIQKNYIKKYTNNVSYFPALISNDTEKCKKYSVAIYNIDTEYKIHIVEELRKKNIEVNDISKYDKNNILLRHKIFLNFNDNYDNELFNEIMCNYCIYNKIIVINDKKNMFSNSFLNTYIFDIKYDFIVNFTSYILDNYDDSVNNMFRQLNMSNKNIITNISNNVINEIVQINKFGFIIIRHVNSESTNEYWIESYNCIRKFYNNKIIIIDDDSNYDYITDINLINCEIIHSEFKRCGEILPYYYLYKYHFFEKTVILHDSTFINNYINFEQYNDVHFIWHFTHDWDNDDAELDLLSKLENNELNDFYHKKKEWYGCYGVQSVIDYNFLENIVNKYNLFILLEHINNRDRRMNFERIFGLICMYENKILSNFSIFGIIHHYIHWGYQYSSYKSDKENGVLKKFDIIKVWSGR